MAAGIAQKRLWPLLIDPMYMARWVRRPTCKRTPRRLIVANPKDLALPVIMKVKPRDVVEHAFLYYLN
jgi:hypothetical protein